ncbi:1,2-dihydroxy-3-keto-5-methylthiopentene dioxygenase [Fusarium oxysporum f. sp. albedinis]|nr:1,2-dihydroxy-3-keto-5-methylthiopentene dioxygenase [Fusarium oxysporum f. sp. albedinis]
MSGNRLRAQEEPNTCPTRLVLILLHCPHLLAVVISKRQALAFLEANIEERHGIEKSSRRRNPRKWFGSLKKNLLKLIARRARTV